MKTEQPKISKVSKKVTYIIIRGVSSIEKKIFFLLVLCTFLLGMSYFAFISINPNEDTSKDDKSIWYGIYNIDDYDQQKSEKIYEELSDEERSIQSHISFYVGYKKLSRQQSRALKYVVEQEQKNYCFYPFKSMVAIGKTSEDEHLTYDDIFYIADLCRRAENWSEIMDGLEKKQKYPDCSYGNNFGTFEYWLDGKPGGTTLYIYLGSYHINSNRMVLMRRLSPLGEVLIDYYDFIDAESINRIMYKQNDF